jgi:integrase
MPRQLKDSQLDTRAARMKLQPRGVPYYRAIGDRTASLGYRRLAGAAGTWLVRSRSGGRYQHERIAAADDVSESDGASVLTFFEAVDAVRKRLSGGRFTNRTLASDLTVADVMDSYVAMLEGEGRSAHSLRDTRYRDAALIRPTLGAVRVNDLTTDELRKWRDGLAKVPPRLRTIPGQKQKHRDASGDDAKRSRRASANRVWTILRAGLNLAYRDGKIASDQAWTRVQTFKKVGSARVRFLTVAEAKRLLNACDPYFRPLVRAALVSGCRYGELRALHVSDYNADSGTLAIRQSKSGHARNVVLTGEGAAFFAEITAGRAGTGDAFMLAKRNGRPWDASNQAKFMNEAVTGAGIKPAIGFHGLRHTYASLCVMGGVPMAVIAKNLGHTSTAMLEKHYGHLAPSYVADEIRKGAPVFGFKPDRKIATLR